MATLDHPDPRPGAARQRSGTPPRAPIVWLRAHIIQILAFCAFVYMLLPNLVVIIFSFNKPDGRYNYDFQQFSLDAWLHPCGAPGMCDSVSLSLKIGFVATIVATILGTMVAFALVPLPVPRPLRDQPAHLHADGDARGRHGLVAADAVRRHARSRSGVRTILIAHIMFCISFVVVTVKARLAGLDPRLEQAAMDLYANERQTFRRITLPLVAPGIAAGALLAFSLSFDDYIITNFNSRSTSQTFPMFVWGAAQRGTPPQINVVGTVMFVVSFLLVGLGSAHRLATAPGEARRRDVHRSSELLADARRLPCSPTPSRGRSGWPTRPARTRARRSSGTSQADLVVVGGGYTGLWTALLAKEDDPSRDVVAARAADGRAGPPPAATAASASSSLTHGFANGLARFGRELADAGAARPREPRRDRGDARPLRDRRGVRADRRALGGVGTVAGRRAARGAARWRASYGVDVQWLDRDEVQAEVALADLPRRSARPRSRRWSTRPSSPGGCAAPAARSASASTSAPRSLALERRRRGHAGPHAVRVGPRRAGRARDERVPVAAAPGPAATSCRSATTCW